MSSASGGGCPAAPFVLLESFAAARGNRSFLFEGPEEQVVAYNLPEVRPALARVERAVAQGRHAAGFIGYEAAPAFDPAMRVRQPTTLPLLWFGIFRHRSEIRAGSLNRDGSLRLSEWNPSVSREAYRTAFERIQSHITSGNTYQVNYTLRLRASWEGEAFALYRRLCRSQRAAYCAYLEWDGHRILSTSPELFFELSGEMLTTRPMKGTYPRGRWIEEDDHHAELLRNSPKDRTENVMIVDLLRNDLGRISEPGSVSVDRLFEVERYDTVLQMTSTIRSRLRGGTGLEDILAALFPCGSVTGAPKIRTMEIITEVEKAAKETKLLINCGGYAGRDTSFSELPPAEVVLRTKLTCSPLCSEFS